MNKKLKILFILVPVLIIGIIFACAPTAYATTPYTVESGRVAAAFSAVSQSGVLLAGVDIAVNVPEFPDEQDSDKDCPATIRGEYVFSNASDTDGSVALLFLNTSPGYGNYNDYRTVTVGNGVSTLQSRCTPVIRTQEERSLFALALSHGYSPDADISPEETVYLQKLTVSGDSDAKSVKISSDGQSAHAVFVEKGNNKESVVYAKLDGKSFTLATVGAPYEECGLNFVFNEFGGDEVEADYKVYTRQTTLKEYFASRLSGFNGKQAKEIYACYVAKAARAENKLFGDVDFFCEEALPHDFAEIKVPAGERVTVTVAEPFFTGINEGNTPATYSAGICVPDAEKTQDFVMNVEVRTPYYILDNDAFVKTDGGYSYSGDGEGLTSLSFLLCSKASYSERRTDLSMLIGILLAIFLPVIYVLMIITPFVLLIGGTALVVWIIVKLVRYLRRRRNKKQGIL